MATRSQINERIAALSSAKRATLQQKLRENRESSTLGPSSIVRRSVNGPAPLSFAQERFWFLSLLDPDSRAYHLIKAYRLTGRLNIAALERSIGEIVRRHEVLRTTFASEEGKAVQIVEPYRSFALPVVDLTSVAEENRLDQVSRHAEEGFKHPFDLATGPLMRPCLYRLGENEHVLAIILHHIVSDGWSSGIFSRDLSKFYDGFSRGTDPELPNLPVQYADYALWQRQRMEGASLQTLLTYWKAVVKGASTLELPTDSPRPAKQSYSGKQYLFELPANLCTRLQEFNRRENVTPFMTLLATYQVLLSRYSRQEDFLIGTPIANRRTVEAEQMIGFFVNTLVLRADLSGEPGLRELVARVRGSALDAFQHQDLPFEKLIAEVNPNRDTSRHPLFQAIFALQNAPEHPLGLDGMEVSRHNVPSCSTRFDLELHFRWDGQAWVGLFSYSTDLFEAETIERMASQYKRLLESMLKEPECPIARVFMMSEAERNQIVNEWNQTGAAEEVGELCVQELIEAKARALSRAVALEMDGKQMCYGELSARKQSPGAPSSGDGNRARGAGRHLHGGQF